MCGVIPLLPQYTLMVWCSDKAQGLYPLPLPAYCVIVLCVSVQYAVKWV